MKILYGTGNKAKVESMRKIIEVHGFDAELFTIKDVGYDQDVEETGTTFEENAKLKAEALCMMCGLPCLADDSGLCVDALDGRPGVYSARYAPNRDFNEGMKMLLKEMEESGKSTRKAHFSCCMALAYPNEKTMIFEGRVDGKISQTPSGNGGFGYDPIFIPEGFDKTFAELGEDIKNKMSHRSRALEKLINKIK